MRHRKDQTNFHSIFNLGIEAGKSEFRVMILDDEQGIIDSLAVVLKKQGYHFVGMTNPLAAIELIRREHYDMLILDYLMEDANGEKVVKKIREFNQEIYILLLTGHKDLAPPLETLRNLDIQGYCEKSDRFDQLLLFIESGVKSIAQLRTIKKIKDEMNESLKQQVAAKTAGIRNLLDNAGQGFLTIGADLYVEPEYSRECLRIFETPIEDYSFPQLIYPDNPEQRQLLRDLIRKVFEIEDSTRRDGYLALLPKNTAIFQRQIRLEYKITAVVGERVAQVMVILTDITEQLRLENQLDQERKILKMIVRVVVNHDFLLGHIKDYHRFFTVDLPRIIRKPQPLSDIKAEICRIVHGLQGNFAQLEMLNTVTKLQQFESTLMDLDHSRQGFDSDELLKYITREDLASCLEEDLNIIEGILGKDFIHREEALVIEKSALEQLERKAVALLPPMECKLMVHYLRRLRFKPFGHLLRTYPDYVMRLAEQQGKSILPFGIEGDEAQVDVERFLPFANSLAHVFRNIVDHGLEKANIRFESGKPEYGKVQCRIKVHNGWLHLDIADDGAGMNPEQIKAHAVRMGLIGADEARLMAAGDVFHLIFREGFSTRKNTAEISGQGVGLTVVVQELDKIGGRVSVASNPGQGTEIGFAIPLDESDVPELAAEAVIAALTDKTLQLFGGRCGAKLFRKGSPVQLAQPGPFRLGERNALIHFRGIVRGIFGVTVERSMLRAVAPSIVQDAAEGDTEREILAECAKIIAADFKQYFGPLEYLLEIGPPFVMDVMQGELDHLPADIWQNIIEFESGVVNVWFILIPIVYPFPEL